MNVSDRLGFVRFFTPLLFAVATLVVSLAADARSADAASSPIISWEYDQIHPATAYSSATNEHLVVWEDHHWSSGNDWDIYGRRVGIDGGPLGSAFSIAGATNKQLAPDVAFNSTLGEFLVVWEDEYSTTDHDILAQRVDTNGILVGSQITISRFSNFESNPAVVYNPANEEYLIVW